MSSRPDSTRRSIHFQTSYFSDPWTLPSPTSSDEGQLHAGMDMPLSTSEIAYQSIINSSIDPNPGTSQIDEEDLVLRSIWATSLSCSQYFLDETLPSDEAILKSMNGSKAQEAPKLSECFWGWPIMDDLDLHVRHADQ
jgi:hypothetical protein